MKTTYTVILDVDWEGEADQWAAINVDGRVLSPIRVVRSAYKPHYILTLEGNVDDYTQHAFEASLNYEMHDPASEVIWWNKSTAT
jgi:hypothetical protein